MTTPTDGKAAAGQATALTVLTPVKPGRTPGLRAVFWAGKNIEALSRKLVQLSFIHYARWIIITGIPYNGPPQQREALHHDYLFFESNFNGGWDDYIDVFSEVVPKRMTAIWGSSYGFPGPRPTGPFKDYIHHNDLDISHYYGAYPQATTKQVLAALELRERLRDFQERVRGLGPKEFHTAYVGFLTDVQGLI